MAGNKLFIDTGAFIAVTMEKDQAHNDAAITPTLI